MVFHVELRQFPGVARAFNLTPNALRERIVAPYLAGTPVLWDDRQWEPAKAKLTIYEGRELEPSEIGLGRGWANATRTGREVTARVLDAARTPPALASFKAELEAQLARDAELALADAVALAAARYPGARVSEQLALAEQAVWQLLHEGALALSDGAGVPIPTDGWQAVLTAWDAWRPDGARGAARITRPKPPA